MIPLLLISILYSGLELQLAANRNEDVAQSPLIQELTYAEIEPLLVKNNCIGCHQINRQQVGPSYSEIAKRKYTNERIVQLIYIPEPKNWPEYATPMAAMPNVPNEEALKIAKWINSLLEPKP